MAVEHRRRIQSNSTFDVLFEQLPMRMRAFLTLKEPQAMDLAGKQLLRTHREVTRPLVQLTPSQLLVQGSLLLAQFARGTLPSALCTASSTPAAALKEWSTKILHQSLIARNSKSESVC